MENEDNKMKKRKRIVKRKWLLTSCRTTHALYDVFVTLLICHKFREIFASHCRKIGKRSIRDCAQACLGRPLAFFDLCLSSEAEGRSLVQKLPSGGGLWVGAGGHATDIGAGNAKSGR